MSIDRSIKLQKEILIPQIMIFNDTTHFLLI